mmetsp:Transcript_34522/g.83319  ORF Transcript_34522/g.83319 Transcript_34522/m.83319 type:complete len:92 (+) Transcript_34522:2427-2702(+)
MIRSTSPLVMIAPACFPPVSMLILKVQVKTPTAAKNPQMTGYGRKEPKLANLKTLADINNVALNEAAIAVNAPNVDRKIESSSCCVIVSSF